MSIFTYHSKEYLSQSHNEYENVLDTTIGVEEVEFTIRKLIKGRVGGHDNISPEHLDQVLWFNPQKLALPSIQQNLSTRTDPQVFQAWYHHSCLQR